MFKYASSVAKNVRGMGTPQSNGGSKQERLLDEMIENARVNETLTIDIRSAHELWKNGNMMIVDVRERDAHEREHVPGAVNVPLHDLPEYVSLLPKDKDATVLSICERGNLSAIGGAVPRQPRLPQRKKRHWRHPGVGRRGIYNDFFLSESASRIPTTLTFHK